jgi:hypothetical protein
MELTVLLFLETLGGIHRSFKLASNKIKVLICIRTTTELSLMSLFVIHETVWPRFHLNKKLNFIGLFILLVNFAAMSLLPVIKSRSFIDLKNKLYKLEAHYKHETGFYKRVDMIKTVFFGVLSSFALINAINMDSVTESNSYFTYKTFCTICFIHYQYKYFLEHYMYLYFVSRIARLIECFTSSINRVIYEIDLNQQRNLIAPDFLGAKSHRSFEDDLELWTTHYQMLIDCSKLVNVCFSKLVNKNKCANVISRVVTTIERIASSFLPLTS